MKTTASFKSVSFEKFINKTNDGEKVTWNVYVTFYEKIPYIVVDGTGDDRTFVEGDVHTLRLDSRAKFIRMVLNVLDDLGDVYSAWNTLAEQNNAARFSESDWNNVLAGSVWEIETELYNGGDTYVDDLGEIHEHYQDGARWYATDITPNNGVYDWFLDYGDYLLDIKGNAPCPPRSDLRKALKAVREQLAAKKAAILADATAEEVVEEVTEEPAPAAPAKPATSRRSRSAANN